MSEVLEGGTKKAAVINVDVAKARTIASNLFPCAAEAEELVAKAPTAACPGDSAADDRDKAPAPEPPLGYHAGRPAGSGWRPGARACQGAQRRP